MEFNVEIVLPSGKKVRVRELNNKEYLSIIKFCQNQDYYGLSVFFEDIYLEPDMNIIDRFYLLIYIRMLFIEPSITLTVNERNITIQLDTILDKIEANYKDLETKFEEGGIEITLDLPCISYYKHIDDLYVSTIKQVKIADDVLMFNKLTKEEQLQVMDNLPANMFQHITKYIQTVQDNLLDVEIIQESKVLEMEGVNISIFSNGMMQFISNLFSTDLNSFYTLVYMFQNTIMPGSNLFFDMSPVETKILLNAHSKRVKEENDKLQKQNQR